MRILICNLRWKQVWELGDATYIKVKQGLRISRWDLCQGEKRHDDFEMWLKSKWNFEMQFRTLKCDLSQNERRHENLESIKLWTTSFLWVHNFFHFISDWTWRKRCNHEKKQFQWCIKLFLIEIVSFHEACELHAWSKHQWILFVSLSLIHGTS